MQGLECLHVLHRLVPDFGAIEESVQCFAFCGPVRLPLGLLNGVHISAPLAKRTDFVVALPLKVVELVPCESVQGVPVVVRDKAALMDGGLEG